MAHYSTGEIDISQPSSSWVSVESSQTGYTGSLPASAGETLSLDIDGDGLFTDNDGDIDGDGIPNNEDSDPENPLVINHHPSISSTDSSADKIAKNKRLKLSVDADDDDGDPLTYTWSVTPDTGWTGSGSEPEVDLGDFEPGTYTFTVLIEDGNGGQTQDSITIEVTEEEKETNILMIIIAVAAVVLVAAAAGGAFLFLRSQREEEEEVPIEEPPHVEPEPIEETYESPFATESYEEPTVHETPAPLEEIEAEEEDLEADLYGEDSYQMDEEVKESLQALPSAEEEEEIDEVSDLERLLSDMEEMEDEVGDNCPECGEPLGPYDSECPACGAQFEVALECPSCGAVVEDDADQCPSCGASFT
jgi:rubrerythrin